ncbi:GMC oxidoreductase [Gloeophyllum trabeum ATCC 11539]|uniref:GMC oxidoreductase n=1 Tax=Gloeophyllum trabeum (strain ATCC 11539 / FP-39264 / Madison 617) TaxID=670483 RepID=S7PS51_GLOTA|nr:GMC oxidoreductase [Gloeophyllum trabeum ATCC 11539]EPQ50631.1 GMC oxidoreductase [Gloeophyllum trabeum ATCC 11539]
MSVFDVWSTFVSHVVGGTAGCVLASRLSEDGSSTVLLIERGGVDDAWDSRVPLLSSNHFRKGCGSVRWPSEPLAEANNSSLTILEAEVLGGKSRINGMVYTRGSPADYNRWEELGNVGWAYDDVEPYFIKSETSLMHAKAPYRGHTGRSRDAAVKLGLPIIDDVNSPTAPPVGVSTMDIVLDRQMHRESTYRTFLPLSLALARKSSLKICTHATVTRVNISDCAGDGLVAKGVYFESMKEAAPRETFYASARKEVVLCCGALVSPQILMLSGIGPKVHLEEHDISVVKDLPGVGSRLQDHLGVPVMYQVPPADSVHGLELNPLRAIIEFLKYVLFGAGLFTASFLQLTVFAKSSFLNSNTEAVAHTAPQLNPNVPDNRPDIEVMPVASNCSDEVIPNTAIFSFLTSLLRPQSVGSVRLSSNDPYSHPRVQLGYLTNPADYEPMRKALKLALRLADHMRAAGYPLKNLKVPASENEADLDNHVRWNLRTCYHFCGTCAMGPHQDSVRPGVVDAELRVHGVGGLRVCDASVFPEIIATHTMAPVVMVAEKCAELLKAVGSVA